MRYNSPERLEAYRLRREYPGIHNALFDLIGSEIMHADFCDLCCSTGLLGQRMVDEGLAGFGVDQDVKTVEQAAAVGLTLPLHMLAIREDTSESLVALWQQYETKVLVARRCISEIFHPVNWGERFARRALETGIRQMFIQGRRAVRNPVHPIHSVHQEIDCLASHWRPARVVGECAYLVPV